MLHNYVPCIGHRGLLKGCDQYFGVKMGKKIDIVLEGVNTLSHQCIDGER